MRIVLVTESFLPDVNGVAHSVLRAAEHLVRRGHEPVVLAPQPAPGARPVGALPFGVQRIASVSLPGYTGFRLGLPTPGIRAAIRAHRPDVVHLASPFVLGAWGQATASLLTVPTVAVYQTDVAAYARAYYRVPAMTEGAA